jgi:hypothetical protein
MRVKKHSEDVATEPYIARGDDANGMKCLRKKDFKANLCSQNWWRYTKFKIPDFKSMPFARTTTFITNAKVRNILIFRFCIENFSNSRSVTERTLSKIAC